MTTTTKRPDGGELKPCPFCGCERIDVYSEDGDDLAANKHVYVAQCWDCCARVSPVIGKSKAIAAWNTRTPTNESPAPQAEASEHAPWSEDEEDAERLLACASRRKKYGDENCECDEDGSCVECEYDMQDALKKRYAPPKHTITPTNESPAPQATKKTYIKPLRTIVEIDARYADQIRDWLNTSPPATPAAVRAIVEGLIKDGRAPT